MRIHENTCKIRIQTGTKPACFTCLYLARICMHLECISMYSTCIGMYLHVSPPVKHTGFIPVCIQYMQIMQIMQFMFNMSRNSRR